MFTEPIFITRAPSKDDLSDDERELAAILYELVASEAAFLNSMRTLDAHFVHNADFYDDDVLPPADRHVLFAGIEACMQTYYFYFFCFSFWSGFGQSSEQYFSKVMIFFLIFIEKSFKFQILFIEILPATVLCDTIFFTINHA
jgi:hypothetical protein